MHVVEIPRTETSARPRRHAPLQELDGHGVDARRAVNRVADGRDPAGRPVTFDSAI